MAAIEEAFELDARHDKSSPASSTYPLTETALDRKNYLTTTVGGGRRCGERNVRPFIGWFAEIYCPSLWIAAESASPGMALMLLPSAHQRGLHSERCYKLHSR